MIRDFEKGENYRNVPRRFALYVGEFVVGSIVAVGALTLDLPLAIKIPAVAGGVVADIHGATSALDEVQKIDNQHPDLDQD